MVSYTVILLAVAFQHLAALTREGAVDHLHTARIAHIRPLGNEKLLAVMHALPVGHREGRLRHREVIDRIQDIGLARTVVTHKAIYPVRERNIGLREILKVDEQKFFKSLKSKFFSPKILFFADFIQFCTPRKAF